MDEITLHPIGVVVESELTEDGDHVDDVSKIVCQIEVYERFLDGLLGVEVGERFDVLFWLNRISEEERQQLTGRSKRDGNEVKGVFARRRPRRPNPIGVTRVMLKSIDSNRLEVQGLDAYPGTPILDIKPGLDKLRSGAKIT
jgi:tRNA-Thr(GGU) m(6)t(6)A37 methyltransferase TsaA